MLYSSLVQQILLDAETKLVFDDFDSLDIPEPEYDIETYEGDEDDGCAGGACKI